MDDFQVDVLVVGAGNAAACAALAAREKGASVAMLEAAPEEERGGNSTYTAGRHAGGLPRRRRPGPALRPHPGREARRRFRQLHGRPVPRRHGPGDQLPLRPRADRHPDRPQLRDPEMDAHQGRALPAELRPAGLQGERQVQVLGRPRGRGLGRRAGPGRSRAQGRDQGRHPDPLPDAGGVADRGGRRGARRRRPPQGPQGPDRRQGRRARLRRLREQRRDAHALSRADLGPRQGARHALQHRRRHQHGAGRSAPSRTATGRAAMPSAGT